MFLELADIEKCEKTDRVITVNSPLIGDISISVA
jgi:hypothetical protein